MTFENIVQLISTVGFPIVCCGAMGWYVKYITDQNNKRIDDMQEQHREESKLTLEAISNNTQALIKLEQSLKEKGV